MSAGDRGAGRRAALTPKGLLAAAMAPLACLDRGVGGALRRLWAFTQLRAVIGGKLDASVVVLGAVEVRGSGRIELGRDLLLYPDTYLETQQHGCLRIGDGVVLSRGVHLVAYDSVDIGAGTIIGEYASIRDANHRLEAGVSPRHTGHAAKPIRIGRNVWIGRGVTILAGVSIGDGAVVGANAVVTKSVTAGDVVAGVPAVTIARRGRQSERDTSRRRNPRRDTLRASELLNSVSNHETRSTSVPSPVARPLQNVRHEA